MADAQLFGAPLKKQGAKIDKNEQEWIEVDGERVVKGSKEHLILTQVFDTEKKYMFELAEENEVRLLPVINMRTHRAEPHKRFRPGHNIIFSSQIIWNGQRRNIRYYAGCTSLFQDKQPQDKDTITQLINQTTPTKFVDGKRGWYGYEKMLLMYMNMCSWNVDSLFRTKTANGIFKGVNADKVANETMSRIDQIEEALQLARDANENKMLIHADYLGIETVDWESGNDLSVKEIRAKYRQKAADDPRYFIESFGNKSLEIKYYIDKALETGTISNKFNPNKATWGSKNNSVICDISGLKSHEAIAQKLFEFSQNEDGAEFLIQLKALYEK